MKLPNIQEIKEQNEERKQVTKANDRAGEVLEPYLQHLSWTNDTYYADKIPLFVRYRKFWNCHTEEQVIKILDWAKEKELHPKQLTKVFIDKVKEKYGN